MQLSGIALDADCPLGMHAVCERLKRRANMAAVANVLALRAARWGLAEPEPRPPADPPRPRRYHGDYHYHHHTTLHYHYTARYLHYPLPLKKTKILYSM